MRKKPVLDPIEGIPQTTVIPTSECPECGYSFDRASHMTEQRSPKPGDLVVCINCATLCRFDRTLRLRSVSEALRRHLVRENPEAIRLALEYQRAILQFRDDGGSN